MSFGSRLRARREELGLKQSELGRLLGVTGSAIGNYENEVSSPKADILYRVFDVLGCDANYLFQDEMSTKIAPPEGEAQTELYQIEPQSFPLLGNIACGEPIFAEERFEAQVRAGARINADFCLRAEGDSMIGARIYDGDIVFVRKQDIVDNGEIAAVLIGDEATLKRVDYDRARGELTLYPENPRYRPLRLRGAELEDVRILGKAVAALADLE